MVDLGIQPQNSWTCNGNCFSKGCSNFNTKIDENYEMLSPKSSTDEKLEHLEEFGTRRWSCKSCSEEFNFCHACAEEYGFDIVIILQYQI